jgi:hypothetical protein
MDGDDHTDRSMPGGCSSRNGMGVQNFNLIIIGEKMGHAGIEWGVQKFHLIGEKN